MTAARRRALAGTGAEQQAPGAVSARRVHEDLGACATAAERARRALQLLVGAAEASGGYLLGIRELELELLASQDAPDPSPQLLAALGRYLDEQRTEQQTIAVEALGECPGDRGRRGSAGVPR